MNKKDLIKEVAESTDCNDHTGALLLVAQFVEDSELTQCLEEIQAEQDRLGYMPRPLMSKRDAVAHALKERHEELCKECRV